MIEVDITKINQILKYSYYSYRIKVGIFFY